jgi:glycosyltransferase involved in cell wall biosynthesis
MSQHTAIRKPARPAGPAPERSRQRVVISIYDHPHYNGGGQAMVDTIARRMADDFDVTIVTTARRGGTVVRDHVRYRTLPVCWAGPRGGQLAFHALLPWAARRIPHDLWIESFTPPFSTSFLPLFSQARVMGFVQNLSGEQMWRMYGLPFFLVERLGLRCYRDIVVLNAADEALIRRRSPLAAVRVIPNGIPQRPLDEQLLGRGEHILYLGRIDIWHKGLDLLLTSYQRSGLAMPLLIAGGGTDRAMRKFETLVAAAGGAVRCAGHVTGAAKEDLLKRSAFVVLPSRRETFGLAGLEGMAYGKPVLHFDLPALGWMDGDVRVPAFDVGAFARAMRDLAGNEAARRELGRVAHAAAQRHGLDEMADRHLALARELLCAPARRTRRSAGVPCR